MQSKATTIEQYLAEVPEERRAVMQALHEAVMKVLPKGFEPAIGYGMMGYVVPHSIYPAGYHCNPKDPLPFAGMASQKNHISFYHMGIYADPALLDWFQTEYAARVTGKLDMGKSCIRFRKAEQLPVDLLAELCSKMSVEDWIRIYESQLKR